MAAIRVSLLTTGAVAGYTANLRARIITVEAAALNNAPMRARFIGQEAAVGNFPNMRVRALELEAVTGASVNPSGYPNMRVRNVVVEALQEILEEVMATDVFPGIDPTTGVTAVLRGLAFDVQKRPTFSNKTATHTSGEDTVTGYWENPRWDYTVTYDYLPDRPVSVGETDLRMLMGFFLSMRGSFKAWLFQDPDDYIVTDGYQITFDGVTTDFNLVRGMGGFYEPIGQLNTDYPLHVYLRADEVHAVPAMGPYTVPLTHGAAITSGAVTVSIGGVALTEVTGAPGAMQFSIAAGVVTFNSAQASASATINYEYLVDPTAYTYTSPNVIAFTTAPAANSVAYADFRYYFVCRFKDDMVEFNKFMNELWELQTLNFRSIIQ